MKTKELREFDPNDLKQRLVDAGQEVFNLRVQAKTGQLEKSGRIKERRRDIAKIKTILRDPVYKEKFAEFYDDAEKKK